VTTMSVMFDSATAFNQNIGSWNTSAVTTMSYMFYAATNFNNGCAAGASTCPMNWNTSQVTNMQQVFRNATKFNQDISRKTGSVNQPNGVISDNGAFDNTPTSDDAWYTGSVTASGNMSSTFSGASNFAQDLDNWCVSGFTGNPGLGYTATGKVPLFGSTGAARCPLRAPCTGTGALGIPNPDGTCPTGP
jgi:surface protein